MQIKENCGIVCNQLTGVINLALILRQPIPPPGVNTSLFHTAVPKLIVIYFLRSVVRSLLMQNVELHPTKMKIWHSKCHLSICACKFPLSTVDWQFLSLRLCESRPNLQEQHVCHIIIIILCIYFSLENLWMRAEGMLGYKSAIPSASGVSAWLHSADPHLQRTKRSLVGVHATKVQFKGIRQGENRLVAQSSSSETLLRSFLLCLSSLSFDQPRAC